MTWVDLPLDDAVLLGGWGQYDGTGIVTLTGWPDFMFPGLVLDPAVTYQFRATYESGSRAFFVYAAADVAGYSSSPFLTLYNNGAGSGTVDTFTVGPGILHWDAEMAAGRTSPLFESDKFGRLIQLEYTGDPYVPPPPAPQPFFTIDGAYDGIGGDGPESATVVTAKTVSYPSQGFTNDDGSGYGTTWPHSWFKFTPDQSTKVRFDSLLSYTDGSPWTTESSGELGLVVWKGPGTVLTFSDLIPPETDLSGNQEIDVVAGQAYYIRVSVPQTDWMVLRVSDYAINSDWLDMDDQEYVLRSRPLDDVPDADLPTAVNHPPTQMDNYTHDGSRYLHGFTWDKGFHGHYQMNRAFGTPEADDPAHSTDAQVGAWQWARQGSWGGQTWSQDPANPDPDISGVWTTGPGQVLDQRGVTDSPGESDGTIGANYFSDHLTGFDGNQTSEFNVYGATARLNITDVVASLGPYGGSQFPDDAPGDIESPDILWEGGATKPELLGLDYAADELIAGHETAPDELEIDWFGKSTPLDENPIPEFDPDHPDETQQFGPDRVRNTFVGGSEETSTGPGELVSDFAAPPYSGGVADWIEIDPGVVAAAVTDEASGGEPGLRFVGLPNDVFSPSIPVWLLPEGTYDEALYGFRASFPALRIHLRPPRHKWVGEAVSPDVEVGYIGAGSGRLMVMTPDGWKFACPASGENGGFGVLKIMTPDGWRLASDGMWVQTASGWVKA